ncbi:hypothetical protein GCM10018773_64200 [Streptomyces candidus]|nr:hypothetical protein GCM10018773_64200 [Streptomyces candidus]
MLRGTRNGAQIGSGLCATTTVAPGTPAPVIIICSDPGAGIAHAVRTALCHRGHRARHLRLG